MLPSTDVSVEQVAQLAQQNTLPEPTLDLSLLSYSTAPSSAIGYANPSPGGPAALRSSPAVAPPPDDPWTTGRLGAAGGASSPHPFGGLNGGAPSSVAGSGLPSGWWKKQEKVSVQFGGQQGFVLNRYMVYSITTGVRGSYFSTASLNERLDTQRGGTAQRRYSEFAFLWDCLLRRYPFRLLPQLPPKRIGRK